MATFRYKDRLVGSAYRHTIRIIELDSGTYDSPLSCSLTNASLDEKPAYDAISYCWGGQTPSAAITCNGAPFSITQNLHDALRQFRSPERSVSLWADALCINQEDIEEKNKQVPMMGRIYGQANEVKIWLGPEDEGTPAAAEALAELSRRALHYSQLLSLPLSDLSNLTSQRWAQAMTDAMSDLERGPSWDPLLRFLQNPWFNRVWGRSGGGHVPRTGFIALR